MRITIEPTAAGATGPYSSPKVIVEMTSDDLDVHQAHELVCKALVAWGYSPVHFEGIELNMPSFELE